LLLLLLATIGRADELPSGSWNAGPRLQQMTSDLRAEIDDFVARLSFERRAATRWVVARASAPCGRVSIAPTSGGIAIACDDRKVAVAPADGTPVVFTGADGRTLGLAHEVTPDGAVVQTFTSRGGTRVNRFVPQPDGTLRVEVTLRAPQLDQPFAYTLTYE
jgi:hypothetical protein